MKLFRSNFPLQNTYLWNGGKFNYAPEFILMSTLRYTCSKAWNYSEVNFHYKTYIYGMVASPITHPNLYWCQPYILYTGNAIWQLYITKPLWCKNRDWSFERELQNKSNSTEVYLTFLRLRVVFSTSFDLNSLKNCSTIFLNSNCLKLMHFFPKIDMIYES